MYCYFCATFLRRINPLSTENLFTKNVVTPCIPVEKTGGLSSDVREMGNVRYEQKAAHTINQVWREPERLQSVRRE